MARGRRPRWGWWAWVALYVVAACGPPLASRDCYLRLLGAAVVVSAVVTFVLFTYAFASVWCFFAAVLSLYVGRVVHRIPARTALDVRPVR